MPKQHKTNSTTDQDNVSRFMRTVADSWNESVTRVNNAIPEDWKKKGDEIGRTISTNAVKVSDYLAGLSVTAYEKAKEIPTHVSKAYDYVSNSISDYWDQKQSQPRQASSYLPVKKVPLSQRSSSTSSTASLSSSGSRSPSSSSLSVSSISSRGSARPYPKIPKVTVYENHSRGWNSGGLSRPRARGQNPLGYMKQFSKKTKEDPVITLSV